MNVFEIGELILSRRIFLNLTQEDLAEMSGVGIRTIHLVEKGSGNPSYQTMQKLSDVLGLELLLKVKGLMQ